MIKRVAMGSLAPVIEETLQGGGKVILTTTGTSMLPLLRHGKDRICLIKPREQLLKKYDLPLFVREDGKYIVHRIVGVTRSGYAMAGDNQCAIEYPVRHSQVIGVVQGILRGGRYISCDGFLYRVYCRLWVSAFPVRRLYLKGKRFLCRAIRFLSGSNGDWKNEG